MLILKAIPASILKTGIELSKIQVQISDETANLSRIYSDVEARTAEKEPNTRYVHCAAHNLNLV